MIRSWISGAVLLHAYLFHSWIMCIQCMSFSENTFKCITLIMNDRHYWLEQQLCCCWHHHNIISSSFVHASLDPIFMSNASTDTILDICRPYAGSDAILALYPAVMLHWHHTSPIFSRKAITVTIHRERQRLLKVSSECWKNLTPTELLLV